MVRAILGVILAFVAMMAVVLVLSMGPWFALGVDGVLRPGSFDGTIALNVWSVLASAVGALAGGWLCRAISRSRTAVIVFAVMGFTMGTTNAVMQLSKPEPGPREPGLTVMQAIQRRKEPAWFTFLVPFLGAAGSLVGGGVLGGRRNGAAVDRQ